MSLQKTIKKLLFIPASEDKKTFGRELPTRIYLVGVRLTATAKGILAGATIPLFIGWALEYLMGFGLGLWVAIYVGTIGVLLLPATISEIGEAGAEEDATLHWKKSLEQKLEISELEKSVEKISSLHDEEKMRRQKVETLLATEREKFSEVERIGLAELKRLDEALAAAKAEIKKIKSDPLFFDIDAGLAEAAQKRMAREAATARHSTRGPK